MIGGCTFRPGHDPGSRSAGASRGRGRGREPGGSAGAAAHIRGETLSPLYRLYCAFALNFWGFWRKIQPSAYIAPCRKTWGYTAYIATSPQTLAYTRHYTAIMVHSVVFACANVVFAWFYWCFS